MLHLQFRALEARQVRLVTDTGVHLPLVQGPGDREAGDEGVVAFLKDADLIWDTRDGKFIFYELNTSVLEEIMLWLTDLKGGAAP